MMKKRAARHEGDPRLANGLLKKLFARHAIRQGHSDEKPAFRPRPSHRFRHMLRERLEHRVRYVHDGVSKPFFAALLEAFAREARACVDRTIVLVLDNAGWHGEKGLTVPDGVRLIFLPPCTSELQPAETLRALIDEPIINKHFETIEGLDAIIGERCAALSTERDIIIRNRAGFHRQAEISAGYRIRLRR